MGKTISITIPVPLEIDLAEAAKDIGMSRSRFIGNILLQWQADRVKENANIKQPEGN